jgi:hypothetical protein
MSGFLKFFAAVGIWTAVLLLLLCGITLLTGGGLTSVVQRVAQEPLEPGPGISCSEPVGSEIGSGEGWIHTLAFEAIDINDGYPLN